MGINERSEEQVIEIIKQIRAGASVHQLAAHYHLTIEEAAELVESVSKQTRDNAASHRLLLRAMLREQAPVALKTLVDICNLKSVSTDPAELNKLALQFKAADKILSYATRFMVEDVVTGMVETGNQNVLQQTLFDFESVVMPDGGTTLVAKPVLRLVENE